MPADMNHQTICRKLCRHHDARLDFIDFMVGELLSQIWTQSGSGSSTQLGSSSSSFYC